MGVGIYLRDKGAIVLVESHAKKDIDSAKSCGGVDGGGGGWGERGSVGSGKNNDVDDGGGGSGDERGSGDGDYDEIQVAGKVLKEDFHWTSVAVQESTRNLFRTGRSFVPFDMIHTFKNLISAIDPTDFTEVLEGICIAVYKQRVGEMTVTITQDDLPENSTLAGAINVCKQTECGFRWCMSAYRRRTPSPRGVWGALVT